jgi:hypothetical protein
MDTIPKRTRACVDLCKVVIRNGASPFPVDKRRALVDDLGILGPGYGEFRTDYEPILRASHALEATVQMETAHAQQYFTTAALVHGAIPLPPSPPQPLHV